jgi:hypothetical protein
LEYAPFGTLRYQSIYRAKLKKFKNGPSVLIYPEADHQDALNITRCKRLDDRRQELCCKTFKKIEQSDSCLNHLLPPLRTEMHDRELRNNFN